MCLDHQQHVFDPLFLLFYFLFFFAPQQPVSTSRHALQTPRHVFQTPSSLFRPPTTPTHTFRASMTPSHAFTGIPGPEMHVQAIICVFLLLFIFFGFRNTCTTARTCVSDVLFYFIPPEMRVQSLVHASLISYLLKMYELL
jgi:hypothetical protein